MITDKLTTFCDSLALNTGAAGDYALGDVIDLQDLRDIGNGTPLYLVISVAVQATSGGSATLGFSLVSDAQNPVTPASASVHLTTADFAVADLVAGKSIAQIAIPLEGIEYERYVGIVQHTKVAAFTAGAVDAFLTMVPQNNKHYPEYDGV